MSILGLALDLLGAVFLAYDVVYGPEARLQVSIRRGKFELVEWDREKYADILRGLSTTAEIREEERQRLLHRLEDLSSTADRTLGELRHWEKHEQRARHTAMIGIGLLMGGFICQGVSALLIAPPWDF